MGFNEKDLVKLHYVNCRVQCFSRLRPKSQDMSVFNLLCESNLMDISYF